MEREKETDFVTHYQQEVKIGKVYAYVNAELKKLDEKYDGLIIIVKVLERSLDNIEKNTQKMADTLEKNTDKISERLDNQDEKISSTEKKFSEISDKNKSVGMWLGFIASISIPLVTMLTALAGYIFK